VQTLVRSKLAFRPPDVNSTLHKNVVQMTSRTEKASHAIKASHVLKDFHQEHLEAVDREQEQLKLKCVCWNLLYQCEVRQLNGRKLQIFSEQYHSVEI
jgi:hypothetical protein